ncbi:MAG TPA: aldose epimerase family protein [Pseudoduganella sp.]
MKPCVDSRLFGELANGEPVMEFTLDNGQGMLLSVLDYGCIIRSWRVLARYGAPVDFVLGFDTLLAYERDTAYFGAVVGRYANRIAGGRYESDGRIVQLTRNEGENHLHGGRRGFHKQCWQAHVSSDKEMARISLCRLSRDGEEGYPGNLLVMVTYELTATGELRCRYQAAADQPTPVSISQHSYFNLAGEGDVLGHELRIDAAYYLPVRAGLVPAGEAAQVADSAFDFRRMRRIGSALAEADEQLALARGYDHNFVLAGGPGPQASLSDPASGRQMDIYTDCPGLQFYSGNYLDGTLGGKGRDFTRYAGLCLEPQHFPDAPNQPAFPDAICRPGAPYSANTRYVIDRWR